MVPATVFEVAHILNGLVDFGWGCKWWREDWTEMREAMQFCVVEETFEEIDGLFLICNILPKVMNNTVASLPLFKRYDAPGFKSELLITYL